MKRDYSEEQGGSAPKRPLTVATIVLFCAAMLLGMCIGLSSELRPTVSEREKRELTPFPDFSLESALNGEFWNGISTWYADTYPLRDTWLDLNHSVESLYGLKTTQVFGSADKKADVIPGIDPASRQTSSAVTETAGEETSVTKIPVISQDPPHKETGESQQKGAVSGEDATSSYSQDASKEETLSKDSSREVKVPESPDAILDAIAQKIQDGILVIDDAAYSQYYFTLENADAYVRMLNELADTLEGYTDVYSILIPNSTQIVLDEETVKAMGNSDEQQAIDYYYGTMKEKVHTVDTCGILKQHKDEYLYFRTDHHWTALGAYYVYQNWAGEKGVAPHTLDEYEKLVFEDFRGSFYSTTQSAAMDANPDTIEAYVPIATNEMTFTDTEGEETKWYVVSDVSDWDTGAKYSCFCGGDNPLTVIENPSLQDGSSAVIVKDSYGNALVPFLVDHYQTVYVIDFRYYEGSILDFVDEKGADDLIIENNTSICGSETVVRSLEAKLLQ